MMTDLILGDTYSELAKIPDKSIDLVIMDPPYELNSLSGGGAFGSGNREYYSTLKAISKGISNDFLELLVSKMKKINIYIYCNKIQILQYLTFFSDKKANFDILSWHKSNPTPLCGNKYLTDTEYILFFREKGVKIYGTYQTKKTWYLSPLNKDDKKKFNHPTVKPLEQIENFIINSSLEGDLVLDPFMGSGTTGVACKKLNRDFIGIEFVQEYFETAQNRIDNDESRFN